MRILISSIPYKIMHRYNLLPSIHKDYIFLKVWKDSHGLFIGNKLVAEKLLLHTSVSQPSILLEFRNSTIIYSIISLVVDNFTIK